MLVGWTAFGQGLYIVALPILSRTYSVEAFGNLAVLQAVTTFTSAVAALRYDVAILLPEEDSPAINLLGLSLGAVALTTGAIVLFVMVVTPARIFTGQFSFLQTLWWLIPVTHFGSATRDVLTHWAIRRKAFATIARTKVSQVAYQLAVQLGLGLAGVGALGLYLGDAVGRVAGAGTILREFWSKDRMLVRSVTPRGMAAVARRYQSYPKYGLWALLLSRAGRDLVPVAMVGLYGATVAGWLGLASRVMSAPLELIGRSVAQVYMGEAADLARRDPRALKRLYYKSTRKLLLIGTLPCVTILALGPTIFEFAFGAQWAEAGVYGRYLTVMLLAQFVNFPLVHTLNVLERPGWQLVWDAGVLVSGLGGVAVLHRLGFDARAAVLYYSCAMGAMFALHFVMSAIAIEQRLAAHEHVSTDPGHAS